jgi:hypothetical protein
MDEGTSKPLSNLEVRNKPKLHRLICLNNLIKIKK